MDMHATPSMELKRFTISFSHTAMTSSLTKVVVFLLGVVDFVYVLCALILFSAIIAWLSLEFSSGIPAALSFTAGALSLVTGAVSILLLTPQQPKLFCKVAYPLSSMATAAITFGLLVAFSVLYGPDSELQMCNMCSSRGMATAQCIASCNDECCFTSMSAPLVDVIIATSSCVVLNSLFAFLFGTVYIFKSSH